MTEETKEQREERLERKRRERYEDISIVRDHYNEIRGPDYDPVGSVLRDYAANDPTDVAVEQLKVSAEIASAIHRLVDLLEKHWGIE